MLRLLVDVLDVEAFLRLPEFKPPFEFFGRRVVQKIAKDIRTSMIKTKLAMAMEAFARSRKLGRVLTSLRVVFGRSVLVPEISFFGAGRLPELDRGKEDCEITRPPDIAVEFLSPGQWPGEPRRKLRHCIKHGGKLGWLIDPKSERIAILRPSQSLEFLEAGDTLSGEDVLPGFSRSLDEVFGWLDQD